MITEVAADFPTGNLQELIECHSIVRGTGFLQILVMRVAVKT